MKGGPIDNTKPVNPKDSIVRANDLAYVAPSMVMPDSDDCVLAELL